MSNKACFIFVCYNEVMIRKAFKSLPALFTIGGVLLLIFSAWLWTAKVYTNPYNVFWGMLSNSLSTSSVTKQISENSASGQLSQYIETNYGIVNNTYALTTIKNSNSSITTASIGTLTSDYEKYLSVQTAQKGTAGHMLDFSKVIGHWAKGPVSDSSDQNTSAPLFVQAALGLEGGNIVPVANLSAGDRRQLINQLHQNAIFDTSYKIAKRQSQNGQAVYAYNVSVEPVAYVAFEKQFAHDIGIKALDNVDPNQYQSQSPIKVTLSVGIRSHQLLKVVYTGTNHSELYSSYGVPKSVALPKNTITIQKLQTLLAQVH